MAFLLPQLLWEHNCHLSSASETTTLPPKTASGEEVGLSFQVGEGATDVKLYLLRPEWNGEAKEVRNGTAVVLALDGSEAALRVSPLSPDWEGTYICRFHRGEELLEIRQEVSIPLVSADLIPGISQQSMDCSSHRPLTLECCIRDRGVEGVKAAWDPGETAFADPVSRNGGSLCHRLTLVSCPDEAEAAFVCSFQGQGTASIQSTVQVSSIRAGDLFCPMEEAGGSWGATKAGRTAELLCPEGKEGKLLRNCSDGGIWGPIKGGCTSQKLLSDLHQAQLLQAGLGDPQTAVPTMLSWLDGAALGDPDSSPQDLLTTIAIMDALSHVALDAHIRLESNAVAAFLSAANKMLSLDPEAAWSPAEALDSRAASGFLQALENLTGLLLPPEQGFNLTLPNLELLSFRLSPDREDEGFLKTFNTDPPASVCIAEEELEELLRREGNLTITALAVKRMEGVLPHSHLASLVMSNAIRSSNGSVTDVVVEMVFGHWNATDREENGEERAAECVFWNHSLVGGVGSWSTQGCQTSSGTEVATNCTCRHLTSFSVLMSAGPVPNSAALTILSTVGLCASVVALMATILIYYLVWTSVVKNKVSYFRYTTLANLAFSLLLASLCFLAASRLSASHESQLCVAAAFFCHFFYLATFFWMLVQALMLFHQLVFVFHRLSMNTVVPAMLVLGYLCPLAIAATTVAATFPSRSYLQEGLCWLSARSKALYAFSVPVLAIVSVNLAVLVVVLLKLMRPSVSEASPGEERRALVGLFKALLVLTPIFGLTWGLGVITMTGQASPATHYAFTLLNAFQGVFILIFGCLMDRKVRGALAQRFCKPPPSKTSTMQSKSETLDSKAGR
ncbi:adhesion G-protein coupled receptor F3 [Anolis sagrei]|uniref:adhesion G-protein coupled receptor F3 n=1 Tax=Anolis sagrei TaxID=38937 RepID=UPI00351FA9AA